MGKAEIEFRVIEKRDWLGRKRFNMSIVDTLNRKTLFYSNQGYNRLIDVHKAIGLIQRYAAIADVRADQ